MADAPIFVTIQLDTPLKRGEQTITEIQLRKPQAGELRGISLLSLIQMEVDSIQKILPRISHPILVPNEIQDPADIFACATEVAGFLLPKGQREAFPQTSTTQSPILQ